MGLDYLSLRSDVVDVLVEVGTTGTLVTQKKGAHDIQAGTVGVTPISSTYKVVAYPYEKRLVDRVTILEEDLRAFLAVETGLLEPAVGDVFTFNAISYSILDVKPIAPSGVTVLYELQLRK